MSPLHVREARVADLGSIDAIYDHYVHTSTCTAQLEPAGMRARTAWFAEHDARHPIVVAEEQPGVVLGWGSLSTYNRRAGYARTVEDSVYVAHDARGRGVGSTILAHLVDRAVALGHHTILASISGDQAASLAVHAKHGFVEVGRMRELIFKHGRWLDVVYLQKHLATQRSLEKRLPLTYRETYLQIYRMHWGHGHGHGHGPGRGRGDPWSEMFSEWWRGPAPRCERGLVRWLVLDAIATQPRHGYEIIQAIAEKSRNAYKPSPGVVYPTLQMLEDVGHARTVAQSDRKTYEITADGKRELREHAGEVAEFYQGGEDDGWEQHADDVAQVMKRVGRVIRLFKMGMRRGGVRPTTLRKMKAILDEALAKLEDLLAMGEP